MTSKCAKQREVSTEEKNRKPPKEGERKQVSSEEKGFNFGESLYLSMASNTDGMRIFRTKNALLSLPTAAKGRVRNRPKKSDIR